MYELIRAAENTWYIDCPAKIGIYRLEDDSVILIDSGNDKDAGRKVQKLLETNGWTLRCILNTHSNADHIGGNALLQQRLSVPVYASGLENGFISHPILEPSFLYGGFPCQTLRNKFLVAQPSTPLPLPEAHLPESFRTISLPGHFFDMVGFRTPDDVWFLADCLSGAEILAKYQIGFIYDVEAYLETLERVSGLSGRLFIPAHAPAVEDIRPLAELNRAKVLEICCRIVDICRIPVSFEDVLQKLFENYGLTMDWNQYVLVGSTVRSYLSYLLDSGNLKVSFEHARLLWHTV